MSKIKIIITSAFIFTAAMLVAQQLPEDPPCGGPFDACVPIDGGAALLLGVGIAYGAKKALGNKKKAE